MNAKSTKRHKIAEADTLRPEYTASDLGPGMRGKYHSDFEAGTNLVLLAPDVAKVFATPQAVNDALRSLIALAEQATKYK